MKSGESNNKITNCDLYNNSNGIHPYSSDNNKITNCNVYNNKDVGIAVGDSSNNKITKCNVYSNSWNGIDLYKSSNNEVHYSNIYNNIGYGVYNRNNASKYEYNATYNWWGSASGPGGKGPGSGDKVSKNVLYDPWLTEPYTKIVYTRGPILTSGKGIWIHQMWEIDEGVSGIIDKLNSAGVKWLIVKLSDSNSYWPGHAPNGKLNGWLQDNGYSDFGEVVTDFHNAGIKVFGWHYVYSKPQYSEEPGLYITDTEAEVSNLILDISGIDGLIINAEAEYEDKGKGQIAEQYMQDIRNAHPTAFIAYSSFSRVTGHDEFPWLEFSKYCDANMPQYYWAARSKSPEEELQLMKEDFYKHDKWHGHGDSVKPLSQLVKVDIFLT